MSERVISNTMRKNEIEKDMDKMKMIEGRNCLRKKCTKSTLLRKKEKEREKERVRKREGVGAARNLFSHA